MHASVAQDFEASKEQLLRKSEADAERNVRGDRVFQNKFDAFS